MNKNESEAHNSRKESEETHLVENNRSLQRRGFLTKSGAILGGAVVGGLGTNAVGVAEAAETVTIGEGTTLTDFDRSRTTETNRGLVLGRGRTDVDLSQDRARAEVRALSGLGSAVYRAFIGTRIQIEGDEQQSATISAEGEVDGFLRAVGDSAAEVRARIIVTNATSDQSSRTTDIFIQGGHNIGRQNVNRSIGGDLQMQLQPGDTYRVWTVLITRIDVGVSDLAVLPAADFYSQGRGCYLDRMEVNF